MALYHCPYKNNLIFSTFTFSIHDVSSSFSHVLIDIPSIHTFVSLCFRVNMLLLRETIPVGSGIIKVASPGCIKEPWASSCMMVCIQKGEMMVNG